MVKAKKSKIKKSVVNKLTKFILIRDDKYFVVPEQMIESFSFEEAFKVGINVHCELKKQLMLDALHGDHYIGDTRVVDGLEASLIKLEKMIPFIRQQAAKLIADRMGKC